MFMYICLFQSLVLILVLDKALGLSLVLNLNLRPVLARDLVLNLFIKNQIYVWLCVL